jgi:hypothetical protein
MTTKHNNAAGYLTSAALHHKQVAQFHREASRHYQVGKNYAHAAHQALVAHGHGLQAIDHGNDAGTYFAEQNGKALPKYPMPIPGFPAKSLERAETTRANLSGAEHHAAAVATSRASLPQSIMSSTSANRDLPPRSRDQIGKRLRVRTHNQ